MLIQALFKLPGLAFIALLIASALAWGGVYPAFETAYPWLLLGILAFAAVFHGHAPLIQGYRLRFMIFFLALLGLHFFPMPQVILRWVSPRSAQESFSLLERLGLEPLVFYPIALHVPQALRGSQDLLGVFAAMLCALLCFQDVRLRKWVLPIFIWAMSALAIWGTAQALLGYPLFSFPQKGFLSFGSFLNKNHAAVAMALATMAALLRMDQALALRKSPLLWGLHSAVLSTGILFAASRTGLLLLLLTLTYLWLSRRHARYGLALVLMIGVSILWKAPMLLRLVSQAQQTPLEQRLGFWTFALSSWKGGPLLGLGADVFAHLSWAIPQEGTFVHPEHVENDALELLLETGLVGMLILLSGLALPLRTALHVLKRRYASVDTQSYALMLLGMMLASCFVFLAPLPFFQLLLAASYAGLASSSSHHHRLSSQKLWRPLLLVVVGYASLAYVFQSSHATRLFPKPTLQEPPALPAGASEADTLATKLLWEEYASEREAHLQKQPYDTTALYDLAKARLILGKGSEAQVAYEEAIRRNPLDYPRRVPLVFYFSRLGEPEFARAQMDHLLKNKGPLSPRLMDDLAFEKRLLNKYRAVADPQSWREWILSAFSASLPQDHVYEAWKRAKMDRVPPLVFDSFFIRAWKTYHDPKESVASYLEKVAGDRGDLCTLVTRLHTAGVSARRFPLSVSNVLPSPHSRDAFSRKAGQFRLIREKATTQLDTVERRFIYADNAKNCLFEIFIDADASPEKNLLIAQGNTIRPLRPIQIRRQDRTHIVTFNPSDQELMPFDRILYAPLASRRWFEIKKLELLVNSRP